MRCQQLRLRCKYSLLQKGDVFLNRTVASPFIPILDASSVANNGANWEIATKPRQTHGKSSLQICEVMRKEGLPKSPNPAPQYRMQLLSNFISLYLPKDSQQTPVPGRTPATWVHLLAHSTLQSSAYSTSLAALCAGQFGTWNRDEAMLNESVRLYASALRELRSNIMNGRVKQDSEATLASIIILSTYEVGLN